MALSVSRWASSARTMTAAADPSDTPEQSKMPSWPAMIGEEAMVSIGTSRRNWARGLTAPFLWFFHAMRVSTFFSSSLSTPYFFEYAGANRENSAGADSSAAEPSSGGRDTTSPENPESFSFSTPMAMAVSTAPDATA